MSRLVQYWIFLQPFEDTLKRSHYSHVLVSAMLRGAILPKLVHFLLSVHAVSDKIIPLTKQRHVHARHTFKRSAFSIPCNRLPGNVMVGYSDEVRTFSNAS